MEARALAGKCYVFVADAITGDSNELRMERMDERANDLRAELRRLNSRQNHLLTHVQETRMGVTELCRVESELKIIVAQHEMLATQLEEMETGIGDLKASMLVSEHIDRRHDFSKDAQMCMLSTPVSIAKRKTDEIKVVDRAVAAHKRDYAKLSHAKRAPTKVSKSLAALAAGSHDRTERREFKRAPERKGRIAALASV